MDDTQQIVLEQNVKKRHSGIDLLRIIAILLICFFHANQTIRGMVDFPTYSLSNFISITMNSFGTFGNILFVICSSFFLVDKSKTRAEKAINILLDSSIISIIVLCGFLISKEPLTLQTIIHQVFPDVFGMNWFVPCYVIFYLLSPILIIGLKQLPKKVHFGFVIFSIIVYGLLSMISLNPVGSSLFQFFYILNLVAFIKWHASSFYNYKKINLLVFILGMVITYAGIFGFLFLTKHNSFFERFSFASMYSPFLVVALIALFNVFEEKTFENKFISYLSSCSLFVYVIHENYLLRSILRVRFYNYMISNYGENLAIVWTLICGIFMFVVGFILAVAYKESLHRLTNKLSRIVNDGINKVFGRLYLKFFKQQ